MIRHHGGHQEEDADAETGQGECHRPGRAGGDGQEGGGGQMQTGEKDADDPKNANNAKKWKISTALTLKDFLFMSGFVIYIILNRPLGKQLQIYV